MPTTMVHVDAALLAHAHELLGSASPTHTADRALAELIGRHRRQEAIEAEITRFATGHYAGLVSLSLRTGEPVSVVRSVTAGWLLDSSALSVAHRPEVGERLAGLLRAGLLHSCPPLELEALTTAGGPEPHLWLREQRQVAYQQVPLSAAVGERALALQSRLARLSRARAMPARALVVAATAIENDLTVLHYDQVFERLGELCAVGQQAVAPLGSLDPWLTPAATSPGGAPPTDPVGGPA
jgi:predicted nucleic acid-binding protein